MNIDPEIKKIHNSAKKRMFRPLIELEGFSSEEQELLRRYGSWMESLANSNIAPFTDEQHRFVAVANQQKKPISEFELVWHKYYQAVKEHEKAERNRIMKLIESHSLSYAQLMVVMDNKHEFNFSKGDINRIYEELERTMPRGGLSHDSFVIFSNTDGQ